MAQYFEVHPDNPQPRLLKQAVALDPKSLQSFFALGRAYALLKQFPAATQAFQAAVDGCGRQRNPFAQFNLRERCISLYFNQQLDVELVERHFRIPVILFR